MGCDIHGWIEVQDDNGEWTGIQDLDERGGYSGRDYEYYPGARNYILFTALSGVRKYHSEDISGVPTGVPNGLPEDISPQALRDSDEWDCDGHSHTHMSLEDAIAKYRQAGVDVDAFDNPIEFFVPDPLKRVLVEQSPAARFVCWYDN